MSFFARKALACWCAVLALPAGLLAQGNYATNGGQYAIVGTLPGDQVYPQVSLNASGGFLVWQDNITTGYGLGISAVR
jgi:outer membrane usher protein FimD/PapC